MTSKFGSLKLGSPVSGGAKLYFAPRADLGTSPTKSPKREKQGKAGFKSVAGRQAPSGKMKSLKVHFPSPTGNNRSKHRSGTTNITFQQSRQKPRNATRLPAISNSSFKRQQRNAAAASGATKRRSPTSATKRAGSPTLGTVPDKFKFGLGIAGTTAVSTETSALSGPQAYANLKRVCQQNDKRLLETLLASKMDVNMSNKMGSTVLMDTVWDGNLPMCSLLLRHKANVNQRNLRGNTPLHFAHERGHKNLIRLLELAGADEKAKNNVGNTPEMVAHMKFVQKHGTVELTDAINKGDVAAVKSLLSQGVDPSTRDISGHTVLMRAVLAPQNAVDMVEALISAKADLNMQDATSRNSALHVAHEQNSTACVEALVAAGAKTWIKNRSGFTAHEWGNHMRYQRMGDLPMKLLQMCEDGTEDDLNHFIEEAGEEAINGRHVFVHACVCAVFPVVANTDTPTDARCIGVANLLMCSADHGCCGVDSLSSSGYDQTGRTPLIIAVGKANGGMVHALLDHKASVNDKELKGARNAPLHAAYDCGDQEIVKVCCTRARVPWRAFVCVCLVALVHMGCMYVVPAK